MKIIKKIWVYIILIILIIFILEFTSDEYLIGKDTVESFGNNRFQIIRLPIDSENNQRNILYDFKNDKMIESEIYYYVEIDKIVYITGKDGYCVLDYKNEKYTCSKEINDFSEKEQEMFS